MIKIYTDGSCRSNGKENSNGGFGVVVFKDNKIIYYYKEQCEDTTNNREELKAILHAFDLAQTKYKNETCIIYSDSSYCVNICNNWIYSWAKNNWINSKKKQVENIDLVQSFYDYLTIDFFNCQVVKITSHIGITENELADALATNEIARFNRIVKDKGIKLDQSSKI